MFENDKNKKAPMCLTTRQSYVTSKIFVEATKFVLGNYPTEVRGKITEFLYGMLSVEKPYMLVTEEGIVHATDLVFSNEIVRDFIFTLHYVFIARWSPNQVKLNGLVNNLATGVSLSNPLCDDCTAVAMPAEIKQRMANYADSFNIIGSNGWLLILLMLILHINIEDLSFVTPAKTE